MGTRLMEFRFRRWGVMDVWWGFLEQEENKVDANENRTNRTQMDGMRTTEDV